MPWKHPADVRVAIPSTMSEKADVIVIGGGVIGVCAAYYLQKTGRQVTLLERSSICSGSSQGNSGLIVPSHSIPLPTPGTVSQALKWILNPRSPFYVKPRFDPTLISWLWQFRKNCTPERMRLGVRTLLKLTRASRGLYEELINEEKIDCNYQTTGLLMLYNTKQGYREGIEEGHLMNEHGLPMEEKNAAELIAMEPCIRSDIVGGVYYPEDAYLNPSNFVYQLGDRIRKKGVTVREGVEVIGFDTNGSHINTVVTTAGKYQPNHVVLAAGSWSPSLVKDLRLNLPIQPAKGYSVTFDWNGPTPKYGLILGEAKVGVNPMGTKLRIAGTLELAGLDLTINSRRVNAVVQGARRYLNGGEGFSTDNTWAGLRPTTPDGVPIIGRVPAHPNLVIATGHATIGMTLGPITGKLVSEIVSGHQPSINTPGVSPTRFQ
jgi:D-amino-acid dehydrogenase